MGSILLSFLGFLAKFNIFFNIVFKHYYKCYNKIDINMEENYKI